jgi:hypothetical protein
MDGFTRSGSVGRFDAGLGENFYDKKLAVSAGAFGHAHDCLFLFCGLARLRLASPDGVWQRPLVFAAPQLEVRVRGEKLDRP